MPFQEGTRSGGPATADQSHRQGTVTLAAIPCPPGQVCNWIFIREAEPAPGTLARPGTVPNLLTYHILVYPCLPDLPKVPTCLPCRFSVFPLINLNKPCPLPIAHNNPTDSPPRQLFTSSKHNLHLRPRSHCDRCSKSEKQNQQTSRTEKTPQFPRYRAIVRIRRAGNRV